MLNHHHSSSTPMTHAYSSLNTNLKWRGTFGPPADGTNGQTENAQEKPGMMTRIGNFFDSLGSMMHTLLMWTWSASCFALAIVVLVYWIQKKDNRLVTLPSYQMLGYFTAGGQQVFVNETDYCTLTSCTNDASGKATSAEKVPVSMIMDYPYVVNTLVMFGNNNIFVFMWHTLMISMAFAVLEIMRGYANKTTDANGWYKVPSIVILLLSYLAFFILFWIPALKVPFNSFVLSTVLYVITGFGIAMGPLHGKVQKEAKPNANASKRTATKYACKNISTTPLLWFGPQEGGADDQVVIYEPSPNQPATIIAGPISADNIPKFDHVELDILNTRHFEYSITSGIFLVGTTIVFDQTADIYIYQQAFLGMLMCNAIGYCMVEQMKIAKAISDQRPREMLMEFGIFLSSTMYFLAAFVPVASVSIGPTMQSNAPNVVKFLAVGITIIYCLFAVIGFICLVAFPPLSAPVNTGQNPNALLSKSAPVQIPLPTKSFFQSKLYDFANIASKFTIIVVTLSGAFAEIGF